MLSCSIWFSAPSLWMGGGLESRCVDRVYGADGAAVRVARHHPHRHFISGGRSTVKQPSISRPSKKKDSNISSAFSNSYMRTDRQTDRGTDI